MQQSHGNSDPLVVVFCGYAGSGKSTASKIFEEFFKKHNKNVVETSFALPIKNVIKYVYDLTDNDVFGHLDRRARERPHAHLYGKTPRYVLQHIATEGFRHLVGDDTWLDHWYRNSYLKANPGDVLTISDFRFFNEYQYLQSHCKNVVFLFIRRKDKSRIQKFVDRFDVFNIGRFFGVPRNHISERDIDKILRSVKRHNNPGIGFKFVDNTGSMRELEVNLLDFFNNLIHRIK